MTSVSPEFLELQTALAGEYSIERELGRGGMGIVYLARDVQLDRDVAIKVLPTSLARVDDARERFLREARTAAGLSHPHIVPIHRVGEAGGFVFFVMSYVEGETLGERLRASGPLPPSETMRVMREVAWALAYAHGRGIVHRDVKPDNILLESRSGRALVTDFGIAQGGSAAVQTTDPGRVMGTAHFMSPEQGASETLDGRSDIYSLGVVGYLAASGRLPFESPNVPALLVRQATEPAPSVSIAAPGLPSALAHVIDRCLDRDASRRFADGEALAAALAPVADTRPALAPSLRAWLSARNPALAAYSLWSGVFSIATLGQTVEMIARARYDRVWSVAGTAAMALAPLVPIVGYHLNQAWRLFRGGHTLADLRHALDVGAREEAEGAALVDEKHLRASQVMLRTATYASAATSALTIALAFKGILQRIPWGGIIIGAPFFVTLALAAACNALDVPLMPAFVRERMQSGLRERLWRSGAGEWLARRLGAPERSRAVNAGAFRATEAALGVAAGDLYAALPKAYREQLGDLPATVGALEARAAQARAEMEAVAALAASNGPDALVVDERRSRAQSQLTAAVAALEGIRLDLLRLHAGASDLAPLTTLMDAARQAGDEMRRLAEGQRDVAALLPASRIGARSLATPA